MVMLASNAAAQTHDAGGAGVGHAVIDSSAHASSGRYSIGARAIGVGTVASPAVNGRSLREGYLTQPMVMGSASVFGTLLRFDGMLNFEGLTLSRGELNAGIFGEGYVDRRHPHTYLHELVATVQGGSGRSRLSVTMGKGFVPFGTDDPMSRPLVKYPVNHHIAQILERVIVSGAVRYGPIAIEAARFNGDEPESPSDLPNGDRLWDSWAARATLFPVAAVELQASVARMKSPELAAGGGLSQRKTSVSARYGRGPMRYALVEWARTADHEEDGETAFGYGSVLAEGFFSRGLVNLAVRGERTERLEEERLQNPFRTPRPHSDFNNLGRTRWDIVTANVSANLIRKTAASIVIAPFLEISRQHVAPLARFAVFEPRDFYGSDRLWSVSAGVRLGAGMLHSRMGRYGTATSHHGE